MATHTLIARRLGYDTIDREDNTNYENGISHRCNKMIKYPQLFYVLLSFYQVHFSYIH